MIREYIVGLPDISAVEGTCMTEAGWEDNFERCGRVTFVGSDLKRDFKVNGVNCGGLSNCEGCCRSNGI